MAANPLILPRLVPGLNLARENVRHHIIVVLPPGIHVDLGDFQAVAIDVERRLGPGHLGAIVSVVTREAREADYYRARLARFRSLSHLTIEVSHKP